METKELNDMLRSRARELGLCDQWYKGWDKDSTKQELIEKYLKGIDFCIKHDYPRLDFARAYFPKKLLLANGIFLDEGVDASNLKTAVILGESNGVIRYDGLHTGNVYVRHLSKLRIEATDGAKVFVEVYEGSRVEATSTGNAKVFIYWHGGEVHGNGNVTIRDKRKAE